MRMDSKSNNLISLDCPHRPQLKQRCEQQKVKDCVILTLYFLSSAKSYFSTMCTWLLRQWNASVISYKKNNIRRFAQPNHPRHLETF